MNMAPQLASDSRNAAMSSHAVAGFTSASSLLRSAYGLEGSPPSAQRLDNVPRFKKPKVLIEDDHLSVPVDCSRGEVVLPQPTTGLEASENLPPKKPRRKGVIKGEEAQTKIKKAKITKPGTAREKKATTETSLKKKAKVLAKKSDLPLPVIGNIASTEKPLDLCLVEALRRRRDWTPTEDTVRDIAGGSSKSIETPSVESQGAKILPSTGFGSLVGRFGFAQQNESSAIATGAPRLANGEAIVKRRKVEIVNGARCPAPAEKPKKSKSPKKKPQTVTEKATAPFAVPEVSASASLLEYFAKPESDADTRAKSRRKSPSKDAKSKPTTTKLKKRAEKAPILLSPETAMMTARNQELVFGTSSQLAREESPALLKDLQKALKESEQMEEQPSSGGGNNKLLDIEPSLSRSSNSFALTPSRNMWSVAARSVSGSLLEAEVINLVDTPKTCQTELRHKVFAKVPMPPGETQLSAADPPEWNVISDLSSPLKEPPPDVTSAPEQETVETERTLPRSVAEAALKKRPKSRSPNKKASATMSVPDQMPNYKGFTDAQLSKEIASYGFKAVKKREGMIVLLKKCWESRKSIALQDLPPNAHLPLPITKDPQVESTKSNSPAKKRGRPPKAASAAMTEAEGTDAPPKKPKGRPKKDSTTTTPPAKRKRKLQSPAKTKSKAVIDPADEIYDSSPPTPSPPRRRSPPKSPGQLALSRSEAPPTETSIIIKQNDTPEGRARLLAQMTKAITTSPPTHDPKNLTWYEKMLIYDPIVLEDLSGWLNTTGLERVGENDKVWPGLVKVWCEARSVCCLWEENLRGGARGRW